MTERFLVVGSGGREHAVVWRLRQENPTADIYCAPGNAGIAQHATCVPIAVSNFAALCDFAEATSITLTIVGPEGPLIGGLADRFREHKLLVCGPSQDAAQKTEGSKIAFRLLMQKYGLLAYAPEFTVYENQHEALCAMRLRGVAKSVTKADLPAAGKGVFLPNSDEEARDVVDRLIVRGDMNGAGRRGLIEERLLGYERSLIFATDGHKIRHFPVTQDFKRLHDGDVGPNTGGMGARTGGFSTQDSRRWDADEIAHKILWALARENCVYRGFLYLGLMLTPDGKVKVIEANCRMGDPEAQAIVLAMGGSFTDLCMWAALGQRADAPAVHTDQEALCTIMTSAQYPEASTADDFIVGLEEAERRGAVIFHSGTGTRDGHFTTNKAGRVLGVGCARGTLAEASNIVYGAIPQIFYPGRHFRYDPGRE